MVKFRGFGTLAYYTKKFLEEHGYQVYLGAWCDIHKDGRLVCDFQIGHWTMYRPPRRCRLSILWCTTEGNISPEAKRWLRGYDYIFAQSKFVQQKLEEIDVHSELMYVGIDTEMFRPLHTKKIFDVISVGIYEGPNDDRKFMHKVQEVCFPLTCYIHTRPTCDYEDMPLLYNMAKVFLTLSGCEGFNIPCLESMACGLPIVGNDAPAFNEFAVGILVKPKRVYERIIGHSFLIHEPDFEKIREELHKLFKNEARIRELGMKAREKALEFDYRKTMKPLLEVLP